MDPLEEIKRLYYETSESTIERDLARAIDLLKSLPDDQARERAAVYMDGLAEMRAEWRASRPRRGPRNTRPRQGPPPTRRPR
jgi:hypothetical protein